MNDCARTRLPYHLNFVRCFCCCRFPVLRLLMPGIQVLDTVAADKGVLTVASLSGIVMGGNFLRVAGKDIRFIAHYGGHSVTSIGLGMQVSSVRHTVPPQRRVHVVFGEYGRSKAEQHPSKLLC
jgi:hypothetical protein